MGSTEQRAHHTDLPGMGLSPIQNSGVVCRRSAHEAWSCNFVLPLLSRYRGCQIASNPRSDISPIPRKHSTSIAAQKACIGCELRYPLQHLPTGLLCFITHLRLRRRTVASLGFKQMVTYYAPTIGPRVCSPTAFISIGRTGSTLLPSSLSVAGRLTIKTSEGLPFLQLGCDRCIVCPFSLPFLPPLASSVTILDISLLPWPFRRQGRECLMFCNRDSVTSESHCAR